MTINRLKPNTSKGSPGFGSLGPSVSDAYKRVKPLATDKNKGYFMIILSLLTLSIFGAFAIRPTVLTAFTLYKEIQDLKEINQKYENKITDVVKAQSEYEKIRDDIPLIYETLPKDPKFPLLISTFEDIAASSSLSLIDMTVDPQPVVPITGVLRLTDFNIKMKLSGDYGNAYKFLSSLLNSQRIVTIEKMDMATDEGTSSGELKIDLTAKSYYEP